ncbi:O-antigen ligase family protein [Patescibacteria group bacterium]
MSVVITMIYGVFQFVELDVFEFNIKESSLGRIFSSLGHPNYFATFLVMTIFPLWAYFINQKKHKSVYILSLFVLIGIILSGSRTAIVAFIIGTIFFLLLFAIRSKKKRLLISSASFLLVITIFLGFLSIQFDSRKVENPILQRFVINEDDRSLISRSLIWKPALKTVEEKVLFGHGWESFPIAYATEMDPQIYMVERLNSIPDKAHNSVVEILVENGLLGLLAYLFAIIATFTLGIKALYKAPQYRKIYLTGVLTSFFSCILLNMLGFFNITHFVYLAFLYANFLFLISPNILQKQIKISKKSIRIFTSIFLALFIAAELILQNIFPLIGNYYASSGIANAKNGDATGAIKNLTLASAIYPDQSQYYYLLAEVYNYQNNVEQALVALDKGGDFVSYKESYYHLLKGKILAGKCLTKEEMCSEAHQSYEKATELAPNYPQTYLNWGIFYLYQNDCENALKKFDKYLELVPNFWENPDSEESRLFYKHNPNFNSIFGLKDSCLIIPENNSQTLST